MTYHLIAFLVHWGITALSLWVASLIFHGLSFADRRSLFISALLLGLANAVIRPAVILLTIPLTVLTFGLFLLVINALMLLLVSSVVRGFRVSGFWTALFASIFISRLSFFVGVYIFTAGGPTVILPTEGTVYL